MKKIFFSFVALAALAACSKSEVAYEQPDEIGFVAVANNITKAPVSGTTYPTDLNLYVNAFTSDWGDAQNENTPNYFTNIEFTHRSNSKWGGVQPQYWPNETVLHFSGYSKSGNIGAATGAATASYNPNTDKLTITGYNPGTENNDLMWFPKTDGYTKLTGKDGVVANMYHTCSWITFMVQGDATTGNSESTYKITSLTMNGVDMTADVVCTGHSSLSNTTLPTYVVWSNNTNQTGDNTTYNVTLPETGVELKSTYSTTTTDDETTSVQTPKNIETAAATTTGGNVVVVPQTPGSINLAWTYKSTTAADISDSATGLSLKLTTNADDEDNVWEPGKHYVYTITIKANEILIAPAPVDWVNDVNHGVTVE